MAPPSVGVRGGRERSLENELRSRFVRETWDPTLGLDTRAEVSGAVDADDVLGDGRAESDSDKDREQETHAQSRRAPPLRLRSGQALARQPHTSTSEVSSLWRQPPRQSAVACPERAQASRTGTSTALFVRASSAF